MSCETSSIALPQWLICPVCLDIPARGSHAVCCLQGHWICGSCHERLRQENRDLCPECRSSYDPRRPPARNYAVEAAIEAFYQSGNGPNNTTVQQEVQAIRLHVRRLVNRLGNRCPSCGRPEE